MVRWVYFVYLIACSVKTSGLIAFSQRMTGMVGGSGEVSFAASIINVLLHMAACLHLQKKLNKHHTTQMFPESVVTAIWLTLFKQCKMESMKTLQYLFIILPNFKLNNKNDHTVPTYVAKIEVLWQWRGLSGAGHTGCGFGMASLNHLLLW